MILSIILALLCLSFLIFIHELGHYFMARRVGMRVETFAIGFGRPIYSWVRNGVKWQIGWLPFGGYVRIKGQETEEGGDPYEIPDGFFGKSPWDRIKVAFAGPFMNIAFALLIFALLYALGGREKNFSEFTHKIGWVDPKSQLYQAGIRPGDEITAYGSSAYSGIKDHLYMPMTQGDEIQVLGNKVNYLKKEKEPFKLSVKTYPNPLASDKGILTSGIVDSAHYIIYNKIGDKENPLLTGSPLENSGLQYGDRILWADGEVIFSLRQLNKILNDDRVYLTIQRQGKILHKRVPRVEVQELKLDPEIRDELSDWQHEANLKSLKLNMLYALPYNLNNEAVIEKELKFIDRDKEEEAFPRHPFSDNEAPLLVGDKIIAVNGERIRFSYELLRLLQERKVTIIAERDSKNLVPITYDQSDNEFDDRTEWSDLKKIANSIGLEAPIRTSGNLILLKTVAPKKRSEFLEVQEDFAAAIQEEKQRIEKIEDPEKRAYALNRLENEENQLQLGIPNVQDRKVTYNPGPIELFKGIIGEIYRTLYALLSGNLSPKWMSGPVGIVQVVHEGFMVSVKEVLYWIGFISLNLGVINLLPIPVLDGGTIVFALYEMISGKRIKPKTMEKLIIPFGLLIIGFFIFLTYHDLARVFKNFFPE